MMLLCLYSVRQSTQNNSTSTLNNILIDATSDLNFLVNARVKKYFLEVSYVTTER